MTLIEHQSKEVVCGTCFWYDNNYNYGNLATFLKVAFIQFICLFVLIEWKKKMVSINNTNDKF